MAKPIKLVTFQFDDPVDLDMLIKQGRFPQFDQCDIVKVVNQETGEMRELIVPRLTRNCRCFH